MLCCDIANNQTWWKWNLSSPFVAALVVFPLQATTCLCLSRFINQWKWFSHVQTFFSYRTRLEYVSEMFGVVRVTKCNSFLSVGNIILICVRYLISYPKAHKYLTKNCVSVCITSGFGLVGTLLFRIIVLSWVWDTKYSPLTFVRLFTWEWAWKTVEQRKYCAFIFVRRKTAEIICSLFVACVNKFFTTRTTTTSKHIKVFSLRTLNSRIFGNFQLVVLRLNSVGISCPQISSLSR